jgi:hypothetical protein
MNKAILFVLSLLMAISPCFSQRTQKVGLVLSGGGARGVVQGNGVPLVGRQLPFEVRRTFVEEGLVVLLTELFAFGEVRVEAVDDQRLRAFQQFEC